MHLIAPTGYDPEPRITKLTGHLLKTAYGIQVDVALWMQAKMGLGGQRFSTTNETAVTCQDCRQFIMAGRVG